MICLPPPSGQAPEIKPAPITPSEAAFTTPAWTTDQAVELPPIPLDMFFATAV